MLNALIVLCLFGNAIANPVMNAGPCPAVESMANFDVKKYMGKWWTSSQSMTSSHGLSKCASETFTFNGNTTVSVVSMEIQRSTGVEITTPSMLYIDDPADPAKMKMKNNEMNDKLIYWVLDTDYESYAVAYHCRGSPRLHYTIIWFLTREQNPSESVFAKLDEIIKKYKFQKSSFEKIKQDDCELRPS